MAVKAQDVGHAVLVRLATVRKTGTELGAKVKAGLEASDLVQSPLVSTKMREID